MKTIKYYICSYADYTFKRNRSRVNTLGYTIKGRMKFKKLSKSHSIGKERQSIDGTKFITWCSEDRRGKGSFRWMTGNEKEYTSDEIAVILQTAEWEVEDLINKS